MQNTMRNPHSLFTAKNWWVWLVLAAEVVLLGFGFLKDRNAGTALTLTGEQIVPYAEECTGDGTGATVTDFNGPFATTAWLNLTTGSYRVAVSYENDGADGTVGFVDAVMPTARYDAAHLPAARTGTVFSLWLGADCENAQVRFNAGGSGTLHINSIQFLPTHAYANTRLLGGLLLFALLDWLLLLAAHRLPLPGKTVKGRYIALALAGITAFACLPLACDYLPFGHDLSIHLARIDGLTAGLQAGQFPVRMYPDLLNGKGYPFGLMYADLLLYPAAFLRILGFSLQAAYKFTALWMTAATAFVAWFSLQKILGSDKIALLGSAVYTLGIYRLADQHTRAALGEYSAMIFLPLILYGFWRIYAAPRGKRDWLPLALGFSGLVQTHLLTLEMAGLLAVVFCLLCWRRTFRKSTLLSLGKAAGATLLWNLWFLVPMLSYMAAGACRVGAAGDALELYQSAAFPAQLLALSGSGTGRSYSLAAGMTGEQIFSPGLALLGGALLMLLCLLDPAIAGQDKTRQQTQRAGLLCLGLGGLCLWLASDAFPWYALHEIGGPVSSLLGKLQFAWRFVSPACALLLVAACLALALLGRSRPAFVQGAMAVLLVLTLLPAGSVLYDIAAQEGTPRYYSLSAIDNAPDQIGNGEYLPADFEGETDAAWATPGPAYDEALTVTDFAKNGLRITMNAANGSNAEAGATLPLFFYPGYTAKAADGTLLPLSSSGGFLRLTLPAGFAGGVTIAFTGLWYWHLCDLLSLISMAFTVVFFCMGRKKSVKKRV